MLDQLDTAAAPAWHGTWLREFGEYRGMRFTSVRVYEFYDNNDRGLLACAAVEINGALKVADIKVTVDREGKLRVVMPHRILKHPRPDGGTTLDTVCPLNADVRGWLVRAVLRVYDRELLKRIGKPLN